MKAVILFTAVLCATAARAQNPGTEGTLGYVLAPPLVFALALDVVLLGSLSSDMHASRGAAITDISFSAVGIAVSLLCLVLGLTASNTNAQVWNALSGAGLALSVGSLAVSIYATAHPPEEDAEGDAVTPSGPRRRHPAVPQLQLLPMIGKGLFGGGVSVHL